jgi:glycerol-3-phosphate acyltransferase PlsY
MKDFIIFGGLAYLIGSIPSAVWLGKAKYGIDVREHGSKNAGATNTFRVLGKKPGIVVLSIDIAKGFLAVFLPFIFGVGDWESDTLMNVKLVCALLAFAGHVLPVFASFKGGKGVATSLGVIFAVHPSAACICLACFLIVFIVTKFVSLGAIVASFAFPLSLLLYFKITSPWLITFSLVLATAVIYAHRKNIKRLLKGEENRMNLFKK